MNRPMTLAVRFLAVLAALGLLSVLVAPSHETESPYASGLTSLTAGSAVAAPACENRQCAREPGRGGKCMKSTGHRCNFSSGICQSFEC